MAELQFNKNDWEASLPNGWGKFSVSSTKREAAGCAYSRDSLGRVLSWEMGQSSLVRGLACDIEAFDGQADWMAAHFGLAVPLFLAGWVCTEVLAKLHNQPILAWLKDHGLFGVDHEDRRPGPIEIQPGLSLLYLKQDSIKAHMAFGICRSPTLAETPPAGQSATL
jgi:hypothetical protein